MNYLIKYLSALFLICLTLVACSNSEGSIKPDTQNQDEISTKTIKKEKKGIVLVDNNGKLGEFFKNNGSEIGSVNKYLWQASIEVLSFLPIISADPFSGILSFGEGKVPNSNNTYSVTVYVSDLALDARSLKVVARKKDSLVSAEANKKIENAILSYARQLRIEASNK